MTAKQQMVDRNYEATTVNDLQALLRTLALNRIQVLGLRRLKLGFDGSVIGTCRSAEGTAVGFNKKNKGRRSYYPLFCAVAQTGQAFNVLHRSGNVHDSNGAQAFIPHCIDRGREALLGIITKYGWTVPFAVTQCCQGPRLPQRAR